MKKIFPEWIPAAITRISKSTEKSTHNDWKYTETTNYPSTTDIDPIATVDTNSKNSHAKIKYQNGATIIK